MVDAMSTASYPYENYICTLEFSVYKKMFLSIPKANKFNLASVIQKMCHAFVFDWEISFTPFINECNVGFSECRSKNNAKCLRVCSGIRHQIYYTLRSSNIQPDYRYTSIVLRWSVANQINSRILHTLPICIMPRLIIVQ